MGHYFLGHIVSTTSKEYQPLLYMCTVHTTQQCSWYTTLFPYLNAEHKWRSFDLVDLARRNLKIIFLVKLWTLGLKDISIPSFIFCASLKFWHISTAEKENCKSVLLTQYNRAIFCPNMALCNNILQSLKFCQKKADHLS